MRVEKLDTLYLELYHFTKDRILVCQQKAHYQNKTTSKLDINKANIFINEKAFKNKYALCSIILQQSLCMWSG